MAAMGSFAVRRVLGTFIWKRGFSDHGAGATPIVPVLRLPRCGLTVFRGHTVARPTPPGTQGRVAVWTAGIYGRGLNPLVSFR